LDSCKTKIIRVNSAKPEADKINQAAKIIQSGGLVAFPTQTFYALGADTSNPEAVKRVFEVKARPLDKPLPVLVARMRDVYRLVQEVPRVSQSLLDEFWPGPLTLVFKSSPLIPSIVRGRSDTIGIRIDQNLVALALIEASHTPLTATSANLSGNRSPVNAGQVMKDLGGRIEAILDGGPAEIGIGSTVLDLTTDPPLILREGVIARSELANCI
jgi:L-threonylcarbamoyladenylate synthase